MVELVVFDVAGTVVVDDDAVGRAFRCALEGIDVPASRAEVRAVMGLPKPVAIERLARPHLPPEDLVPAVQRAHEVFSDRMVDHYLSAPEVRPIAGAESTLLGLREEGIWVALDTGFDRRILDALLLRLGWFDELVDATIASDEVARGRPHPDMILELMDALHVRNREAVMKVGDTPADMAEGRAAGCRHVIGVRSGTGGEAELWAAGASAVLDDVSALPRLLFGSPRSVDPGRPAA